MMRMYCFIRDSRKADALFTENSLHRKLSFREARLSETGLPRITVVGSPVSEKNPSWQHSEYRTATSRPYAGLNRTCGSVLGRVDDKR
jgi:hypothetical protein